MYRIMQGTAAVVQWKDVAKDPYQSIYRYGLLERDTLGLGSTAVTALVALARSEGRVNFDCRACKVRCGRGVMCNI